MREFAWIAFGFITFAIVMGSIARWFDRQDARQSQKWQRRFDAHSEDHSL